MMSGAPPEPAVAAAVVTIAVAAVVTIAVVAAGVVTIAVRNSTDMSFSTRLFLNRNVFLNRFLLNPASSSQRHLGGSWGGLGGVHSFILKGKQCVKRATSERAPKEIHFRVC